MYRISLHFNLQNSADSTHVQKVVKEEAVIDSNKCQKSDYLLLAKTINIDVTNVRELEEMQVMYPKYNKKYNLEKEMSLVALVYFE